MHLHVLFGFIKAFNATKIRLHVTEQIEMQPANINLISELLQHNLRVLSMGTYKHGS